MRKVKILLLLCFWPVLQSCEYEIENPVKTTEPRLFVECFALEGADSTFIEISSAVPASSNDTYAPINNLKLNILLNSNPLDVDFYGSEINKLVYFFKEEIRAGDKLELRASADGFPDVSASVEVSSLPDVGIKREFNSDKVSTRYTFSLPDDVHPRYYGVIITEICILDIISPETGGELKVERDTSYSYKNLISDIPEDDVFRYKPIAEKTINNRSAVVFEDGGLNYDNVQVSIDVPYVQDKCLAFGPDFSTYRKSIYKVELFSLSKMAYQYINPKINDVLTGAGLVSSFLYLGNIEGGYGIVECMGKYESEWMPNVEAVW